MESSPAKRRKVSPTASAPVDASNTDLQPTSRDGPLTPGRASFMSPTKASLSRFNPNLLRPRSAGQDAHQERSLGAGRYLSQPPQSPGKEGSIGRLNATALRRATPQKVGGRLSASPIRRGSVSPTRVSMRAAGSQLSAPPRRSRTPGRVSETPTNPFESSLPRALQLPEQSPLATAEEAVNNQLELELQADAAQQSETAPLPGLPTDIRRRREKRREPELPPTPEQLGLEPLPEKQREGLLSSSPSARVSKRRIPTKSSPLKPRDANGQRYVVDDPEGEIARPDEQRAENKRTSRQGENTVQQGVFEEESAEYAQRRSTLARLNSQVDAMQADLLRLEAAVVEVQEVGAASLRNEDDLKHILSVVTSTNPTHKLVHGTSKPLQLSMKLSHFLPFAKRTRTPAKAPVSLQAPISSYQPIDSTNALPSLQALTPQLHILNDRIVESSIGEGPLQRQHIIKLDVSPKLLSAQLSFSVNVANESITSSSLDMISPWADQELGFWIRNQLPKGDVSAVGWACGRYWELALLRAKTWARCCKMYPQLLGILVQSPALQKGAGQDTTENSVFNDTQLKLDSHGKSSAFSLSAIRIHLGRQSLKFSDGLGASLVVKWTIAIDWTGESESRVSAHAEFPKKWREGDSRGSLKKVPKVFAELVSERGVGEGIRMVVGLLFPK